MSKRHQLRLNARCYARAVAGRQWGKLPHFHRGLWRALVGHDRLGNALANVCPVGLGSTLIARLAR